MNISAKTEYACVAILELAKNVDNPEPVRIRDIAGSHGIPSRFLVQILLQLKGAGIVSSTRGAAGGYRLAVKPSEITLNKVMGVIDGNKPIVSNLKEDTPAARVLNEVWNETAEQTQKSLEQVSFEELVRRTRTQQENMYYI